MATRDEITEAILTRMTVPVWPHVGMALGLSRNATYEAAKRGDFSTIRINGAIRAPTAPLRKLLGIESVAVVHAAPAPRAA